MAAGRWPAVAVHRVGAAGGKRQAHKVEIDDLSVATHDPLLAQLRYRLRKEHGAPRDGKKIGVTCVFSRESVAAPDPSCAVEGDGTLNCAARLGGQRDGHFRPMRGRLGPGPDRRREARYNRRLCRHAHERKSVGKERGTLAQLVEQRTFNPLVAGSTPVRPTNNPKGQPADGRWPFVFGSVA